MVSDVKPSSVRRGASKRDAAADNDPYERDFHGWAEQQAALARAGRADLLDLDHVAEELEASSRSERATLRSSYRVLLVHLLKWRYQPERRSDSRANTIGRERDNIELQLEDNPGLKSKREALFRRAYRLARREAARETKLPIQTFPTESPSTLEQAVEEDFWPEADEGAAAPA